MKAAIVCVSVSHGNTKKVADVMGEVLGSPVVEPEVADLTGCDLVGFGSGIFMGAFHSRLRDYVAGLPDGGGRRAFVFTTSGFTRGTASLAPLLQRRGFEVVDTFGCRGHDTFLPFRPVGGIRKGHPNADDLAAARRFAEGLRARLV